MKFLRTFVFLSITFLFNGCASPIMYFNAAPRAGQILVAVPPAKTTFGVQEIKDGIQSEVLFEPSGGNKLFNGTAVFWVYAKNLNRTPFNFSSANIRVVDKDGKPVAILLFKDVVRQLQANKSRQEWSYLILSSMVSALAAAPYMTSQQSGTYNGYTSNGQYVYGNYAGTQQNSTVAYMAQQENLSRTGAFNTEMDEALNQALWNVERLSLKEVRLEKGQFTQGIVTVPLPSAYSLPNRYRFIVDVEGSTYEYDFPISNSDK